MQSGGAESLLLKELLNVEDFHRAAKARLPRMVYDYYASGANDMVTLGRNRTAFDDWLLRPRALVDVSQQSLQTTVLGHPVAFPILIAPTAMQRMAHPEGEVATARAARRLGTGMVLSSWATASLEEVSQGAEAVSTVPKTPRFFQLYVYRDRGLTTRLVKRAEAAGYSALVLTVDTPQLGKREPDMRNAFHLPEGLALRNFVEDAKADHDKEVLPMEGGSSGLAAYVASQIDRSLSWKDIHWLRSITTLPIVCKGIMTAEDAWEAVRHGVEGIVVSNHGARQLDHVSATIDALPEVVEAVREASMQLNRANPPEIFVDGGFRRGTDVLKALALGARAVFVGRPVLWGLAVAGENGVHRVMELLKDELTLALALAGCPSLAHATPALVAHRQDAVTRAIAAHDRNRQQLSSKL